MNDHLIKESDLKETCYCGRSLAEARWESNFDSENHYKTSRCECGAKIRIKVDFMGSGHDHLSPHMLKSGKKNIKKVKIITLDNMVNKIKK